jgi:hypothetical protein
MVTRRTMGLGGLAALMAAAVALALTPGAVAGKKLVDPGSIQILQGQGTLQGSNLVRLIVIHERCGLRQIDVYRRDPAGPTLILSTRVIDAGLAGPSFVFYNDQYGLKAGDVVFASADEKVAKIRVRGKKRKLVCSPIVSPDVTIQPAA